MEVLGSVGREDQRAGGSGVTEGEGFASAVAESRSDRPFHVAMIEQHATLDGAVQVRIMQAQTLDEAADSLLRLLDGGFAVWRDGNLLETRALVGRLGRLRIIIRSREHAPPHFHVETGDTTASFSILDGSLLSGRIPNRDRDLVGYWYRSARPLLVKIWNQTRPSDCPVGPIDS